MKKTPASRSPRRLTIVITSKNAQADCNRVRLKTRARRKPARRRRRKCPRPRRECNQSSAPPRPASPGSVSEIFGRDGVGAAAAGIRRDGLAVGKVNDGQQHDDADADRARCRRRPAAPSGISSVRAASGPYAAELSASRPKMGIPAEVPTCSARSSRVESRFPSTISRTDKIAS